MKLGGKAGEGDVARSVERDAEDAVANGGGDAVEHVATTFALSGAFVALEPAGEPETAEGDVFEYEGAGGDDERLLGHASVGDHDG